MLGHFPNLFPILPASPVKHIQNGTVGAKKSKVLQVDSEANSYLLEFGPFTKLTLLKREG